MELWDFELVVFGKGVHPHWMTPCKELTERELSSATSNTEPWWTSNSYAHKNCQVVSQMDEGCIRICPDTTEENPWIK